MKILNKGAIIPKIEAVDLFGKEFDQSDIEGKRTYLTFLRTASCPFCNLRVHQLIQKQSEWNEKGITTIAVFASPADEILHYMDKQKPPFTILADPEEKLYKNFGIGHSRIGMFKAMLRMGTLAEIIKKGFFTLKAMTDKAILTGDFLIDENGIIQEAYYGKDFGDHLDFKTIDNW